MSITEDCKTFKNNGYTIENGRCTPEVVRPYTGSCSSCLYATDGGLYCSPPGSNMNSKETCNGPGTGTFCWCPDPTPYTLAPTPTCKPCGMTCCGHGESCSYEAGGDPYCRGLTS